ncbi:hypothetical protein E4K10_45185 [Streptomyces sp. T1317-0309]|nr:hypothetical protein E4K10_45185 [Streptomyces sp. T1317-0309]
MKAATDARVVQVSSSAHLLAGVDFEDIHFTRRPYDPWIAYGQSKTAIILFTRNWQNAGRKTESPSTPCTPAAS